MFDILSEEKTTLRFDYEAIEAEHRAHVRDAAIEIHASTKRAQKSILTIGERLTEIKALLPHGQFLSWVEIEFDMQARTAQRLMSVAARFAGKYDTVTLFSDSALYLLSAPSTPETAIEQAIDEARASGEKPTKKRVREIIADYVPPPQRKARAAKVNVTRIDAVAWREPVGGARDEYDIRAPMSGEVTSIMSRLSVVIGDLERCKKILGMDNLTIIERAESHCRIVLKLLEGIEVMNE